MEWFIENRPDLTDNVASMKTPGMQERLLLAVTDRERLRSVLRFMLDEREFLSPYGVRSLSRRHLTDPFVLTVGDEEHRVDYDPAESTTGLFGGNSNWRGPVWFPVNYLIIESLQKFHHYYTDDFKVECPTGSKRMLSIAEVAQELSNRLTALFLRAAQGRRAVFGTNAKGPSDAQ